MARGRGFFRGRGRGIRRPGYRGGRGLYSSRRETDFHNLDEDNIEDFLMEYDDDGGSPGRPGSVESDRELRRSRSLEIHSPRGHSPIHEIRNPMFRGARRPRGRGSPMRGRGPSLAAKRLRQTPPRRSRSPGRRMSPQAIDITRGLPRWASPGRGISGEPPAHMHHPQREFSPRRRGPPDRWQEDLPRRSRSPVRHSPMRKRGRTPHRSPESRGPPFRGQGIPQQGDRISRQPPGALHLRRRSPSPRGFRSEVPDFGGVEWAGDGHHRDGRFSPSLVNPHHSPGRDRRGFSPRRQAHFSPSMPQEAFRPTSPSRWNHPMGKYEQHRFENPHENREPLQEFQQQNRHIDHLSRGTRGNEQSRGPSLHNNEPGGFQQSSPARRDDGLQSSNYYFDDRQPSHPDFREEFRDQRPPPRQQPIYEAFPKHKEVMQEDTRLFKDSSNRRNIEQSFYDPRHSAPSSNRFELREVSPGSRPVEYHSSFRQRSPAESRGRPIHHSPPRRRSPLREEPPQRWVSPPRSDQHSGHASAFRSQSSSANLPSHRDAQGGRSPPRVYRNEPSPSKDETRRATRWSSPQPKESEKRASQNRLFLLDNPRYGSASSAAATAPGSGGRRSPPPAPRLSSPRRRSPARSGVVSKVETYDREHRLTTPSIVRQAINMRDESPKRLKRPAPASGGLRAGDDSKRAKNGLETADRKRQEEATRSRRADSRDKERDRDRDRERDRDKSRRRAAPEDRRGSSGRSRNPRRSLSPRRRSPSPRRRSSLHRRRSPSPRRRSPGRRRSASPFKRTTGASLVPPLGNLIRESELQDRARLEAEQLRRINEMRLRQTLEYQNRIRNDIIGHETERARMAQVIELKAREARWQAEVERRRVMMSRDTAAGAVRSTQQMALPVLLRPIPTGQQPHLMVQPAPPGVAAAPVLSSYFRK